VTDESIQINITKIEELAEFEDDENEVTLRIKPIRYMWPWRSWRVFPRYWLQITRNHERRSPFLVSSVG
jgi:hypothetical protein